MENRRVYRGIEDLALSGSSFSDRFPHSEITRALVHRYRELRDMREHRYWSMLGLMSMYSHSKADFGKGNDALRDRLSFALSAIPYYTNGKGSGAPSGSRERAVEFYNQFKKNLSEEMARESGPGPDSGTE